MKIAMVTSVHRWNDPRIFEREARSLVTNGHEVIVISPGAPRITTAGIDIDGPNRQSGRLARMTVGLIRLVRKVPIDVDAIHIHDPELLVWIAARLVRRRRTVHVYDVHEDYGAQIQEKPWIPRILRPIVSSVVRHFERAVAKRCDVIVAATPSVAGLFSGAHVVANHPINSELPEPVEAHGLGGIATRVVHTGELNDRRGAATMLEAFSTLSSTHQLDQIGPVKPPNLLAASIGIWEHGILQHSATLDLVAAADIGIILFEPGANHDWSQPNKLFEYFGCGLPVVASDLPRWRQLADECGALVEFVDPTDSFAVISALRRLTEFGDSNRRTRAIHARKTFDWADSAEVLNLAYKAVQHP